MIIGTQAPASVGKRTCSSTIKALLETTVSITIYSVQDNSLPKNLPRLSNIQRDLWRKRCRWTWRRRRTRWCNTDSSAAISIRQKS